jgi:hypothetical protein
MGVCRLNSGKELGMIRAIIGTVAVLAGFAVLENSVDASTGFTGSCKATQAYALLQPGQQLPVRAIPTPEGKVVGALATRNMTADLAVSAVTIAGSQSGWARIVLGGKDYTPIDSAPQQFGWIPADQLTVDTRIVGTITTFSRPGLLGEELGRIEGEDQKFRVLGCRGDLLQVINAQHGNVWIDRWCGREAGCRGS